MTALIGEDPIGVPNNLVSFISQVAIGRRKGFKIFGNDYPTPEGTGVRDYVHVMDVAEGHVAAVKRAFITPEMLIVNLGSSVYLP